MSTNFNFLRTYGIGSSSSPNITLGTSTTSGIFSQLTNQISVSISGTELVRYSSGLTALFSRLDLNSGNEMRFYNTANTNYVALKSPSAVTTQTLTLPANPGTVRQAIITDGAGGILSFGDPVAGSLRSASTEISVSGATAPTTGQVLTATSSTSATWQSIPSLPASIVFNTDSSTVTQTITTTGNVFASSISVGSGTYWVVFSTNVSGNANNVQMNVSISANGTATAVSTRQMQLRTSGFAESIGTQAILVNPVTINVIGTRTANGTSITFGNRNIVVLKLA